MTTVSAPQKSVAAPTAAVATPLAGALALLLIGNMALAVGPWFVRLADCGPVSAGFWRLILPLPIHALLARRAGQALFGHGGRALALMALAGVVFGLDLVSWHVGIGHTRLGNATLFGNLGSIFLMIWGLFAARRWPGRGEVLAIGCAIAGAAILLGRSLQIATDTLVGDLLCIAAGLFYFGYFMVLRGVQGRIGNWPLVFYTGIFAAPVMLAGALGLHEPLLPHAWWPVIVLALLSQVIGQGLLVGALTRFSPLVIGLALLTQPAVSVVVGLLVFGERPTLFDMAGMALVSAALVLAPLRD